MFVNVSWDISVLLVVVVYQFSHALHYVCVCVCGYGVFFGAVVVDSQAVEPAGQVNPCSRSGTTGCN